MPEVPDTPEAQRRTAIRYGQFRADGYDEEGLMSPSGSQWGFPFMHVGVRWYDPLTGRFLQADPIGILGGLNVYAYVDGAPTVFVDPAGLVYRDKLGRFTVKVYLVQSLDQA